MLSFKFDHKSLIYEEYDIKYYGTIDLSAEIYFDKKSIGRINALFFNKDCLNVDYCELFFNTLPKEFQQFIIDTNFDVRDDEDEFLKFINKFKPSFDRFADELYEEINEENSDMIDNIDFNFDNLIYFKSLLIVKNIKSNIKIDRNELIRRYIESIKYIFPFDDFYTLDLGDKKSIKTIKELSNMLDTRKIRELKSALDECNDRGEILNNVLLNYCEKNNTEYIDKRNKGGCLWIVAGNEIVNQMKLLKEYDIKFIFSKNGGKSSKYRKAWYIK